MEDDPVERRLNTIRTLSSSLELGEVIAIADVELNLSSDLVNKFKEEVEEEKNAVTE